MKKLTSLLINEDKSEISSKQKTVLANLGYDEEAISKLTKKAAWQIIHDALAEKGTNTSSEDSENVTF